MHGCTIQPFNLAGHNPSGCWTLTSEGWRREAWVPVGARADLRRRKRRFSSLGELRHAAAAAAAGLRLLLAGDGQGAAGDEHHDCHETVHLLKINLG